LNGNVIEEIKNEIEIHKIRKNRRQTENYSVELPEHQRGLRTGADPMVSPMATILFLSGRKHSLFYGVYGGYQPVYRRTPQMILR
jgi:hypothetical protein